MPVDVSVQSSSTAAVDSSHPEAVLFFPHVVSELTSAAQQECGGKRIKRSVAKCVRSNKALQETAKRLVAAGLSAKAREAVGVIGVSNIAISALGIFVATGVIPNNVQVDIDKPSQTLTSGTSISSTSSGSSSTITSPASTVTPGDDMTTSFSSTASTSTLSAESCWQYTGTNLSDITFKDLDDDDDSEGPSNPSVRFRRDAQVLEKRDRENIDKLGNCDLGVTIRRKPDHWTRDELMGILPQEQ